MKFLPRKFRESRSDWYSKKGKPWHIAVAIRNSNGEHLEMMTFVNVFESVTSRASSPVLVVLDDVFSQLKTVMSEL